MVRMVLWKCFTAGVKKLFQLHTVWGATEAKWEYWSPPPAILWEVGRWYLLLLLRFRFFINIKEVDCGVSVWDRVAIQVLTLLHCVAYHWCSQDGGSSHFLTSSGALYFKQKESGYIFPFLLAHTAVLVSMLEPHFSSHCGGTALLQHEIL